jgi:hypothetical protein
MFSGSVCAFALLAALALLGAVAQQPVFEHNMDVDKKSAECEVCQVHAQILALLTSC